jgi:hypothetical protein
MLVSSKQNNKSKKKGMSKQNVLLLPGENYKKPSKTKL